MRKETLLIPFLIIVVLIIACEKIDVSKLTDKDLERISEKLIVCNPPYIRYASECCLDQNDNKICDRDERELTSEEKENEDKINKETPSGIKPPVEETPTKPTHPETPAKETEVFQEKTPFIGGTSGISLDFEKGYPPQEITDQPSSAFQAIVILKNDGEFNVDRNDIRVTLIGFDPADFGKTSDDLGLTYSEFTNLLLGVQPDDILQPKKRDTNDNLVEGGVTHLIFPNDRSNFIPRQFQDDIQFTFRANVCYYYETHSQTKLCILKDMINIKQNSICEPIGSPTLGKTGMSIYSSSAPIQVQNFRQNVTEKDKISFRFDIIASRNVDIFFSKDKTTPKSGFDAACPRDPRSRREFGNNVGVEIKEIPDSIVINVKCGGLDGGTTGVLKLVNGRRTITCVADLVQDRVDSEKSIGINLKYNVLDYNSTQVTIKHIG